MKSELVIFVNNLANHTGWLGTLAWKGLALATVVMAAALLWRRGSAAARHLMWAILFGCLLCLPLFQPVVPLWHGPAWAAPQNLLNHLPDTIQANLAGHPAPIETSLPEKPIPGAALSAGPKILSPAAASTTAPLKWAGLLMAVWLAGVGVGALRWLVASIWLHRLKSTIPDCDNQEWLTRLDGLRADYQIRQPVILLIAEASVAPVTWGWQKPVVVLPAESRTWPAARLDIVLRHELAHVKRRDCLLQDLAQIACLLYWYNPLVWLAARKMRAEREKACDDLVLNAGAAPGEYAGHLVALARQFTGSVNLSGAMAMARPAGLEQRVTAILDGGRNRRQVARMQVFVICAAIFGMGILVGGYAAETTGHGWALKSADTAAQLQHFIAEKKAQEAILLADDKQNPDVSKTENGSTNFTDPNCAPFFAAAKKGDWLAVTNLWSGLESHIANPGTANPYLHGTWLQPLREVYGAVEAFTPENEKYSTLYGHTIIQSIPPGSVYFGGTDAGRFIITALSRSQITGDPFYILTQNALADATYVDYLRFMYGTVLSLPSKMDTQKAFQDYIVDLQARAKQGQLKPGEQFNNDGGRISIGGVTAVMTINGLLVKDIFDTNTNRDFYLEESYPLDWMRPSLEPHGLILKLDRQPLAEMTDDLLQTDHDYWVKFITPLIGGWLTDDTTVADVIAFDEKVFGQHDLSGFQGDPAFVQSDYAVKAFSKLRLSQADLFAWRMNHAANPAEQQRLARAADFAYRQALALYPYSKDIVKSYTDFLQSQSRTADAELVRALKKPATNAF